MSVAHPHVLFVHGRSAIHRLPAREKLAALAVFVLAVAATPREQVWAFAAQGVLLVAVATVAGLPPGVVARRLAVGLPFLLFAVALPFVGGGDRVQLGPASLSIAGVWAAWSIIAKALLCLAASIIVIATTPVPEILGGLSALRVPDTLVGIAGFMVRYLDLIAEEARRMYVAMLARGYRARWIWQARPLAGAAGLLFVRSHERGERVYAAMLARGYGGRIPTALRAQQSRDRWVVVGAVPVAAWVIAALALVVEGGGV